jgi:hypothetical protein
LAEASLAGRPLHKPDLFFGYNRVAAVLPIGNVREARRLRRAVIFPQQRPETHYGACRCED